MHARSALREGGGAHAGRKLGAGGTVAVPPGGAASLSLPRHIHRQESGIPSAELVMPRFIAFRRDFFLQFNRPPVPGLGWAFAWPAGIGMLGLLMLTGLALPHGQPTGLERGIRAALFAPAAGALGLAIGDDGTLYVVSERNLFYAFKHGEAAAR